MDASNQALSDRSQRLPAYADAVLVGLIGQGIALSRTPAMHEAEGHAQGLRLIYRLVDTDTMARPVPPLAELISFGARFGFAGFNITHPFKQQVLDLLDDMSEAARAVGSVNTVVFEDGRRIGHNTDLWGFRESFRRGLAGAVHETALLLGAGGAGAAVAFGLLDAGVGRVLIHDVDPARTATLLGRLDGHFGKGRAAVAPDLTTAAGIADGIVNATPVGMALHPGLPLPADLLRPQLWVADIVYFPLETELLRTARARGCRTLSGKGMAIFQAARAFELFTGLKPDVGRMTAAFDSFDAPQPAGAGGLG